MLLKIKKYLNQKTPIVFPILIVIFYALYRLTGLYGMNWDTIGYHHIAQQLINGNFNAIFNETWSPLQSVLLVFISKITGLNFFISQFILELFLLIGFILIFKKLINKPKLYQFILSAPLLLLPMSNPDQLFGLIMLIFIYVLIKILESNKNLTLIRPILKLTFLGLLMLFAKGVGSIIFIGVMLLVLGLMLLFKNRVYDIKRKSLIIVISFISFSTVKYSWILLKENRLNRPAAWSMVGEYNLSIINLEKIAFNKVDHWENVCVHGFTPDLKTLSMYRMNGDSRNVDQLSWLDIAWHNRQENKTVLQTYFSSPKYLIYAIANFWIMVKEFYPFLILLVVLLYVNINQKNIGNLVLLTPVLLQIGIVVLVHIEDRFLNILFYLLLIVAFRTIFQFDKRELSLRLNILSFASFFPACFMFISNTGILNTLNAGGLHFNLNEPVFITQKIATGNYLLENNVSTAYSVVNNPGVYLYKPGGEFPEKDLKKLKLIDNKYVVEESN